MIDWEQVGRVLLIGFGGKEGPSLRVEAHLVMQRVRRRWDAAGIEHVMVGTREHAQDIMSRDRVVLATIRFEDVSWATAAAEVLKVWSAPH